MLFSRKSFRVPAIFHPFLGRDISVWGLILVYGFGLGMTMALFVLGYEYIEWVAIGKKIILFIVVLDIISGGASHLTSAVKEYYMFHPRMQHVLIIIHFIQPLLLYYVFMNGPFFYIFLYIYAAGLAFFLLSLQNRNLKNAIVILSIIFGSFLVMFVFKAHHFLFFIAFFYMVKLIACVASDTALEL